MRIRLFLFCGAAVLSGRVPAFGASFLPDKSFSDGARGLTSAPFLKNPPSARFEALAGACLTLGGPQSFFCNPAGLAYAQKKTSGGDAVSAAALAYESLLEGSYRAAASFVTGSRYGAFASGLLYNNSSPGMDKFDAEGLTALGGLTAYDTAAGAAFAHRGALADFGFGVKFIKSKLAQASGVSAALDAGFVFRERRRAKTEVSLTVRNFGFPLKLGSGRAPLPLELGGGLKWAYAPGAGILLEGRLPCDHAPYLIMAGEWFFGFTHSSAGPRPPNAAGVSVADSAIGPRQASVSGIFMRGGMNFKNYDDLGALGAFAGGFGLKLGAFGFDYAFVPYGELGSTHRTEISWRFSGAEKAEDTGKKPPPGGGSVAVARFENGAGVTETQAEVFRNLFEAELGLTGAFKIAGRQKLEFILAEKKLAAEGKTGSAAAAELGRLTGADLAVSGSVSSQQGKYLVEAKVLEVSGGKILRTASAAVSDEYFLRQAARELVAELFK